MPTECSTLFGAIQLRLKNSTYLALNASPRAHNHEEKYVVRTLEQEGLVTAPQQMHERDASCMHTLDHFPPRDLDKARNRSIGFGLALVH